MGNYAWVSGDLLFVYLHVACASVACLVVSAVLVGFSLPACFTSGRVVFLVL